MSIVGEVKVSDRGFHRVEFADTYGNQCQIIQSSLIDDNGHSNTHLWIGIPDPGMIVMARDAHLVGIETEQKTGWVPYVVPEEVVVKSTMHLNRKQVQELVDTLQAWLNTGEFKGENK